MASAGCSGDPDWRKARFLSPPCPRPEHQHRAQPRTLDDLRSVTFDLDKYRPVQERVGQDPDLALAIAISGGGQRAGNFGLGALLQLERLAYYETNNVLQEVDYFSTVSGGGLPVAGYVSGLLSLQATGGLASAYRYSNFLYAACQTNACGDCATSNEEISGAGCLYESMRANYHATLLEAFIHPSVLFSSYDRGDVLEENWSERLLTIQKPVRRSLVLKDIFVPTNSQAAVRAPYWIANATLLGNGAVFPFTPDVVEHYGVSHYNHEIRRQRLQCAYDLPLAVGLKTSASFPVAIPATTLKVANTNHPAYLQLSDGGLADNLGVLTAAQMLRHDRQARRKVLLVIDAYGDDALPVTDSRFPPNPFNMLFRTTDISLDSWRGRYRASIVGECERAGIKPLFLSFEDLKWRGTNALEGGDCAKLLGRLARRQPAQLAKTKTRNPGLTDAGWFKAELEKISAKARATPTTLSLSPAEQDIVVTAGKLLICLHREEILSALKSN